MPSRGARNPFQRWLGGSATPLFVFSADRRLLAFNSGCERLTGWPAADLVNKTASFGSTGNLAAADGAVDCLCPPPEAIQGAAVRRKIAWLRPQGEVVEGFAEYLPLCDESGNVEAVLGRLLPAPAAADALPSPEPPAPKPPSLDPAPEAPVRHDLEGPAWNVELVKVRARLRQRFDDQSFVAHEPAMQRVLAQVDLARNSTSAVHLVGEPGTGKEHFARVIHFTGPHRANWFVPLDCQRMAPEELQRVVERLLEVHHPQQTGHARMTVGTLYLASLERMPRDLQSQIARTFADPRSRPTTIRLVSSSEEDARAAVQAGRLLPEIHALAATLVIELPPLRERPADLPLLVQHFVEELNRKSKRQIRGVSSEVLELFARHPWPGNLDELAATIRAAQQHAGDALIRPSDLPFRFTTLQSSLAIPPRAAPRPMPLDALLERVESNVIRLALERSRDNKSAAAEILGVNRARLYRRMEQLGLGSPDENDPEESPGSAPSA